jgi:hypothetical protein
LGAVALLLGVAYFFKYAVDNDWIGPMGRVALGALAGFGVLGFAEVTRGRTQPVWTQVMLGVGLAFLLLSAWASFALYGLVSVYAAFAAFFVVSLLGGVLSMHHRGEAILILSLAAALSAPVLLSTHHDNPLGLFAYLLLVTTLAHAAALRMDFRWALWLGVGGVLILFFGWYDTFFKTFPPDEWGGGGGAYYALSTRVVPLLAVVAFCVEWFWVFMQARGRHPRLWPLALLVATTLFAHAGFAALLFDHPIQLGALLIAIGVLSAFGLQREGKTELLALPLLASFAVLATSVDGAPHTDRLALLVILGLWGGVYALAFLRSRTGPVAELPPRTLVLLGGVGLGLCILTSFILGHHQALELAGVLLALSLAYALLSVAARRAWVAAAALGISFCFLAAHMPQGSAPAPAFIGISAAWSAVYFGAVLYALMVRGERPTPAHLLVLSGAGLAFVFLALINSQESQSNLRAALLTVVGVADLAAGALLLRPPQPYRREATVLLGQALGLFAAATALFFSGATVTIVWLVLAAVVAWLAGEEADPLWITGAFLLFAAAAMRLFAIDLPEPARLQGLYLGTSGVQGVLDVTPFLNPRGYALLAGAVTCWTAARATARSRSTYFLFRQGTPVLVTLGHVAMAVLVVGELLRLLRVVPAAPRVPLSEDEFAVFLEAYQAAAADQTQRLAMLTTLLMGLYATLLVGIGFGVRDRLQRYLGLALLAVTLGKLALYDVWQLPRAYQILVLMGVGALLLGASFLYARFGKRLVAILRDGVGPAALLCLIVLSPRAFAFEPNAFRELRALQGVNGAGLYRVEVDPALYARQPVGGGLEASLRIAGPRGEEVPFLVREVPVAPPPVFHPSRVVDPVTHPDGSVSAVLDLGKGGLKHTEVRLEISGEQFFRRTRVEVSPDERHWARIAQGAMVYRVRDAAVPTDQLLLRYPASDARYLKITLLPDTRSGPLRITSGEVAYQEAAQEPIRRSVPIQVMSGPARLTGKRSAWNLDVGVTGLPLTTLKLELGPGAFEREAELTASDSNAYWRPVASSVLHRDESGQGFAEFQLSAVRKRYFQLLVQDGDDAPLGVQSAAGFYRAQEIVFRADAPGAHTLYIGSIEGSAPAYDLPAVLARSPELNPTAVSFGTIESNPLFGTAEQGPRPFTERYATPLAVMLGVLLLALSAWTVRLLRQSRPGA